MSEPRVMVGRPPNFDAIVETFGPLPPTTVFAYGDVVYSLSSPTLPHDLLVHEQTHLRQQAECGGAEAWWARYLEDAGFRLSQELEAYRAQIAAHGDRASRRACLRRVARDLSSAMYGRLVSADHARQLLTGRT